MICQNCGQENDMDATFCERCGARLERSNFGRRQQPPAKQGMSSSTKWLIVIVVILVGVLGVTAGALLMNQGSKTVPNNTQTSVSESQEQVTYKADWHQVTSFSGVSDDYRSFSIKGQRFKIVMKATPTLNYNTNFMNVDISGTSGIIGSGNLNWGPNDALSSKEKTVEFTGPSGTYYSDVSIKDLESWTVTVYDYY